MYVSIRIYGKDVLKVDFLSVLKRKQNAMESVAHPYVKLPDNEKYLYCFGLAVMTLGSSKAISETKPMFEKVLDKISLSQEDRERLISDINSQFDLRITQLLKWIDKRKEIQYLLLFDMQLIAYHTLWAQSYCEKIMKEFSLLFSLEPRENEFIRLFVQATKNNNQEKARMLYDKFCADGFFITYKHLHYICPILNFNLKLSSLILDKGQKYVIDKETSIENDIMVTNGSVLVIDHAKVKLGGSIRIDGGEIYITDRSSSPIWMASSRVGARISPWTSSFSGSICSIMGMPKAKVLPVPVGALAMTSFHCIKCGIASAWMVVGQP